VVIEMAAKPIRPGIWRLKRGGFVVLARVTDPRTGREYQQATVLRGRGTTLDDGRDAGGMRSRSGLGKPSEDVAKALGWKIHFTPRGIRRTFQDLARQAHAHDVITRAIGSCD
jgi:hypothetical protein